MFSQDNVVILRIWSELTSAKLWRFSLLPQAYPYIPMEWRSAPSALNAHDLTSIGTLFCYLHAAAGFPVNSTWLASIHAGKFAS